ncbi:hypothetical protein [Streptomyces gobitricini]|uniref:Uncharacterized protein n=1 Tax=Streptomyces gobitricini TaxID=68211 RepID=A0ABN3MDG6_9ACTN
MSSRAHAAAGPLLDRVARAHPAALGDGVRTTERNDHMTVLLKPGDPGNVPQSARDVARVCPHSSMPGIAHLAPSGARAAPVDASTAPAPRATAEAEGGGTSAKVINGAVPYAVPAAERHGRGVSFAEATVRDGTALPAQEVVETVETVETVEADPVAMPAVPGEAWPAAVDGRRVGAADGYEVVPRAAGAYRGGVNAAEPTRRSR